MKIITKQQFIPGKQHVGRDNVQLLGPFAVLVSYVPFQARIRAIHGARRALAQEPDHMWQAGRVPVAYDPSRVERELVVSRCRGIIRSEEPLRGSGQRALFSGFGEMQPTNPFARGGRSPMLNSAR